MSIYIGLIIFSALFIILAWKRVDWALAAIIFGLPSYLIRFHVGPLPMTLLELMILLAGLVWIVKLIKEKKWRDVSFSSYRWLMLFLLLFAGFSVLISDNRVAALGLLKAYFFEPMFFFLILMDVFRKKKWTLVINALGASAILVSIPAIIQKFTGWWIENPFWRNEATRRVTSVYEFPNAVGLYLAPIVMFFVGLILIRIMDYLRIYGLRIADHKIKRIDILNIGFWLSVILVGGISILWAETEGALIGLAAGIGFLGLFFPNKKLRIVTLVSLVSLVAFVALVPLFRNYFIEKGTLSDRSGQIRQQQWKETWKMLTDGRELIGAGLSNYRNEIAPYHASGIYFRDNTPNFDQKIATDAEFRKKHWQPTEIYLYPHNIILNLWSELGLGGLLIFLAIVLKFFWNYFKVKNEENKKIYLVLLSLLVVILIHGLVDVPYFKNDLSVFFWMLIGLSVLLIRNKNETKF